MFARFKSHWSVIPAISVGIIFVFHNADPGESREARFHVRQDLRQTGSKAIAPAKPGEPRYWYPCWFPRRCQHRSKPGSEQQLINYDVMSSLILRHGGGVGRRILA